MHQGLLVPLSTGGGPTSMQNAWFCGRSYVKALLKVATQACLPVVASGRGEGEVGDGGGGGGGGEGGREGGRKDRLTVVGERERERGVAKSAGRAPSTASLRRSVIRRAAVPPRVRFLPPPPRLFSPPRSGSCRQWNEREWTRREPPPPPYSREPPPPPTRNFILREKEAGAKKHTHAEEEKKK